MDYNDNDYEGQNLHLAGEESSKISSVLRPFALPKFDFDDSLHGHLRFDSLVENEVFLGIPSQEDNQWIEDFSRGDSGIEFNSSAAESCPLPRHINVWSEATSSESVEMLLKAVGQEEMVLGENLMEGSEPGDQLGSPERKMETNLGKDNRIVDIDCGNSSLPLAEVAGNICSSSQSAVVEGVHTEHAVQAGETNISSYGVCVGSNDGNIIVNSENSNNDLKRISDSQGKTESSSQNVDVSVRECADQDKISDISIVSTSCVTKTISDSVEEQEEGCNQKDGRLSESAVGTDITERHSSREISSELEPSKEEHAVESCIANVGEATNVPREGESVSSEDRCNEIAFVVEHAGGSQLETVVIKQVSEGASILLEKSSVSLKEEGFRGLGIEEGSDAVTSTIYDNTKLKQVSVIQPSIQNKSHAGSEDICPGSHSSLEVPHATFEVVGNPPDKDGESNYADGPGQVASSIFEVGSSGEKSVNDDMSDVGDTFAVQTENVEDGDHATPPSVAGSRLTSAEDIISMQVDAHEDDPVCVRDVKKLLLDSSDVVCDGKAKDVSTFSGEGVKVNVTPGSQPSSSSSGDYPALNTEVEDTKLTSSCVESDELVATDQHSSLLCDTTFRDQSKEIESDAPEQPITSVSKEPLESDGLAPVIETKMGQLLDSEAGKTKSSSPSVSLVETLSVSVPDEGRKEFNEKMDNSSNDLTVQDGCAEAAATEKPMAAESGRNSGTNSSTVPVSSCAVEIDQSSQVATPEVSCTDLPQSEISKQLSLKRDAVQNIGIALTTSEISGINVSSKEDGTFSFDTRSMGGQSTGDSGKGLQSFSTLQACKLSLTGEGSSSAPGRSQTDPIVVKEISHVSLTPPSGGVRGPSERKARRAGGKSGRASANKGNQIKETTPLRQSEKWEKSSQFLSPLGTGQLVTFESVVKPRGPVSIPTSSLPDLNTSASSSAFFQQPFTDLQQVQLRAQIFVYGSLIQGAAPDEACMVSAFDGGRSVWEPSWRACVERFHGQKSVGRNTDTPVSLRLGAKVAGQTNRQGFSQSEAFTSVVGRASNKAVPSPVVNPISLSSPLWNISSPCIEALPPSSTARSAVIDYQAVSPLNPYQTPPLRNYVAHTTWSSQAPFPVPWLASSQTSSACDISTNYPAFPITAEPVKLTPSKESSLAVTTSSSKHVFPVPTSHTGGPTIFPGTSSLDLKKVKALTGQTADTKTRKRKKTSVGAEDAVQTSVTADTIVACQFSSKGGPAVEDHNQFSLMVRNQGDHMPTPVVSSLYSTSVAVATPSSFVPKSTTANHLFSMTSDQVKGDLSTLDKRALNVEGLSKVEEAKLQAEEAAAHAATAISQCEGVWRQLGQPGMISSDAQSKLASAAVAIAAAASVAKVAAAAAKIASSAALQAKQMADEALAVNSPTASPLSILIGGDRNNAPSLAISAAREASRKRIEAASAATRHAENLDAIVKAAELAAEAVSHAGKVVSMAEPFSLTELAEAGPNNYWKVSPLATKSNAKNKSKTIPSNVEEVPQHYMNQHEGPDKAMHFTSDVRLDSRVTVEENLTASGNKHGETSFKPQKDEKISDSFKTVCFSDPDMESRSTSYALSSIKEDSCVEVLKDRGDLKMAWFSARVVSLKDGEALVSYMELQSDEGSEQLKEWISIEAEDGDAPKVRIPHPMTALQLEVTRKRRRAAVKDYTWSVGDRVDAWVKDCWREGIVAEKNNKEATTLSVHFPAQGETLMVKVWHLRPTLIWSDGRWIEWCRPGHDHTSQGDTPVEKRPKLGSTSIESKGKAKVAKNIDFGQTGTNDPPRLPLSANEKVFSIGSMKEGNKPNTVRTTMKSGVEKEGSSRVVFGVPKPGKKRKFMEVSKHYVSDRVAKTNVPNDSVKLSKFLPPQGFKNNSKLDLKEKQGAESKPRAINKSGKPPNIPSRTLTRKDDSSSPRPNARNTAISDIGKGSISNDGNESGEQNLTEFGSFSNVDGTSGGSMVFTAQGNRKKTGTRNIKPERLNQGKFAAASKKSTKNEANEQLISEVSEPRRSNRRIQPTSRLLEGLQSSLIISKISSSHDKSHRSKGTTRGNNNRG